MSKISTIYDLLVSRLESLYPNHNKIVNPHKPEENNEMILKKGYGLRIGPGSNPQRYMGCKASIVRQIDVIFTRKHYAHEQALTPKQTTEKLILEDQIIFIKDVETNPDLENTAISKIEYVSDGGIEFIYGDKDNFIMIETVFSIEYEENL